MKYHSFSKLEKKAFVQFLKKRTVDQDLISLIKYTDKSENASYSNEQTAEKLYKKKDKSRLNKLNKTLNRLNKSIDEFIYSEFSFNNFEVEITQLLKLMRYYNEKNLEQLFIRTKTKLEKKFATYQLRDNYYFETKFKIEKEYIDFCSKHNDKNENLQTELDYFNQYLVYQKLMQVTTMLNKQLYLKKDYKVPVYDLIKHHPAMDALATKYPTIQLWYWCSLLLQNSPDVALLEKTIVSAKKNYQLLSRKEARHIFIFIENILSLQQLETNVYLTRLLDLYLFQIEHKLLAEKGFIMPTTFLNIITVSLKIKPVAWVIAFIQKNKDSIMLNSRFFIYNHCMAKCFLIQDDIEAAASHIHRIQDVNYKNIHINMANRRLLIRILYTQQQTQVNSNDEKLIQSIYSYKKYIHDKNNQIAEIHRKINLKFVNLVNRLLEASTAKKIEKLQQEINNIEVLPDKKWFLEVINNL